MIINELIQQSQAIIAIVKTNWLFTLLILAALWVIQFFNAGSQYRLNSLGIEPRKFDGLFGIIFTPFLHGSWGHLLSNSIPFFVLMNLILIYGKTNFLLVSAFIIIVGGLITWLIARRAVHVGASGLVMGYWSYLLVNAIVNVSVISIILAALCLFYFANMWINVFPTNKQTSWESHLAGFAAGIAAALLYI